VSRSSAPRSPPDWDEDLDPDAGLDDDEPFVAPAAAPTVGAGSV
jgi:hypothetical protein